MCGSNPGTHRLKKSSPKGVGEPASPLVLMQWVVSSAWSSATSAHCWLLVHAPVQVCVIPTKPPPPLVWAVLSFLEIAREEE